MRTLYQVFLVASGSAVGGLTRWGLAAAIGRLGPRLPWGTFVINLSGSLFLGWFLTALAERWLLWPRAWLGPDDLRLMIGVGFTGAYTTFSTFEYESYGLLRDGDSLAAIGYMALSVGLGLLGVRLGVALARGGG